MLAKKMIDALINNFRQQQPRLTQIENALQVLKINTLCIDHFACIDLPGVHSGITVMQNIFEILDFEVAGRDYLAAKQNDFTWLSAKSNLTALATTALPQVVVADFRLAEMPAQVAKIISHYANLSTPFAFDAFKTAIANQQFEHATQEFVEFFSGRSWPLPTLNEYLTVKSFNELLAWVLVFGRQPNHFTFATHLMGHFDSLFEFNDYLQQQLQIQLNSDGGLIKGNAAGGIMQSSTANDLVSVNLQDNKIDIANSFVEFVWRYSKMPQPHLWSDYYTGFIAAQADHVIQSLYITDIV